ncbi:phosphoenolpyruvate synthase, partial [Patescibacteria group bacterium]|nr:phosphoenolpyruvate synthase [Patescibacteria group bacterium]
MHPVTEDPDQLIIEAGWGLGEAIVSGSITPDNYVVDKRDWSIVDRYIADQERMLVKVEGGGSEWREVEEQKREAQKLPEAKVIELAQLVVHIERHYGFPCDIEWAMENNEIYIVQSRPITTLSPAVGP